MRLLKFLPIALVGLLLIACNPAAEDPTPTPVPPTLVPTAAPPATETPVPEVAEELPATNTPEAETVVVEESGDEGGDVEAEGDSAGGGDVINPADFEFSADPACCRLTRPYGPTCWRLSLTTCLLQSTS